MIGGSTRVRGRVSGDGDLRIEGSVEGDIAISGDLMIADGAQATSNASANAVAIAGELVGEIHASGPVHIHASGRVRGDIHGAVAIDEGAEYTGNLVADFELPEELGGTRRR